VHAVTALELVGTSAGSAFPAAAGAEGDRVQGDMIEWEGPGGDGADTGEPGRDGLAHVDLLGSFAVLADDDGEQPDWQERALCAQTDPEAFFPEKGGSTREAKRICLGCEVRAECLEYALAHDERFGIWGGLSERERRRLKRRAS
jgi:WhiB family transcriptional regulator, redox-sensing transcriptional regulator